MVLSNLSSAQLGRLVELIKEKEALATQMERVDLALQNLESGGSAPRRRGRKPGSTNKVVAAKLPKGRRGARRGKRLREPLLALLKSAGASGMAVKDIAAKLKVKPGNVFSWFYTTGKKVKGISKVGEAKYAYSA